MVNKLFICNVFESDNIKTNLVVQKIFDFYYNVAYDCFPNVNNLTMVANKRILQLKTMRSLWNTQK